MRRPRLVLPVLLALALVIGACGSSAGDGNSSTSTSTGAAAGLGDALAGRTFLSQSVTVDGVDHPLVGDQPISVQFGVGDLSARPGCNLVGASYSLDGDRLVWSSGSMTEMACTLPGLMEQDTWFGGLLGASTTLELAGDQLTMTSGGTVIVFIDRETADPDRPLIGTEWTLESIIEGQGASSVPAGASASLRLPDESRLTWQGCNMGGAPLSSVGASSFTVGDMMSTQKGCPPAAEQVDSALRDVLQGPVTYAIDGPVLHLVNGDRALDFRSA